MATSGSTLPNAILKIPPPIWAILLVIVAALLDGLFAWDVIARFPLVGFLLALIGFGLAAWGRVTFAREGTEIMPNAPQNKALVTRGPFSYTRNPMYLGLILLTLGIGLYSGTLPFLLVPAILFLLCNAVFIPFEEANMQRQFTNQYTDYTSRVRRWI